LQVRPASSPQERGVGDDVGFEVPVPADARIATQMYPTITVAPAWRGFLTGRAAVGYDPMIFPDAV